MVHAGEYSEPVSYRPRVSRVSTTTRAKSQSSKKPQSPRFGFDFVDDRRDSANHSIQIVPHISPLDCSNLTEAYGKRKLGVVLPLESSLGNCKRYFISVARKPLHNADR